MFKIGIGFDVHRFAEGRRCVIGGVDIPHSKGLLGHSDADVLTHAICDALLGAAGLGDIGTHFPDNNPKFKDINSQVLLGQVKEEITKEGFKIENIDSIVMAEKPKINPHRAEMKTTLSKTLEIEEAKIGIKATTTEKLGFVGREEGIAAQAVALLSKVFVLLFFVSIHALAVNPDSLLKCSAKYFGDKHEFKFDFQMLSRSSGTGGETQRRGTLITGGKDRFTLTMPDMQIYSDGTNLWQYNPLQKQVLIKLLSDLENKLYPSEVLFRYLGTTAISVKPELWKGSMVHALTLDPSKYKDQFKAMEVWLSPKDCSPLRLYTIDNIGNDTWYSIENLSKGSFPESTFKFKAPAGTDEIDMR